MYQTILVAVDPAHGERGAQMAEQAKALMGKGANLTFISVMPEVPGYVAFDIPKEIRQHALKETEGALQTLVRETGLTEAHVNVRHGSPHREILAGADDAGADLIVVASHKPGLEDYLLGSTAGKVVRHARCSVLVVR